MPELRHLRYFVAVAEELDFSRARFELWALGVVGDTPLVGLAPQAVANDLPEGIVAAPPAEPGATLETRLVWRADTASALVDAFRSVAGTVYDPDA